jgi:uncharacterized protein YrrD
MVLRSAAELKGWNIVATDGEIGEVYEFYFDDESWTIRYVVADVGSWLTGRRVLISPAAVSKILPDEKQIRVALTKEQVRNSPDVDTDKPFDRQQEINYLTYYGWPSYWGMSPAAAGAYADAVAAVASETISDTNGGGDPHLHRTREVTGYYIEAEDGDIGHVEDFIFDDESWKIRYVKVDTANWLPGREVIISPQWIKSVDWFDSKLHIALTREGVRNSPEYHADQLINRDYETKLYEHYGRPKYW